MFIWHHTTTYIYIYTIFESVICIIDQFHQLDSKPSISKSPPLINFNLNAAISKLIPGPTSQEAFWGGRTKLEHPRNIVQEENAGSYLHPKWPVGAWTQWRWRRWRVPWWRLGGNESSGQICKRPKTRRLVTFELGGGFKYFYFHPDPWGKDAIWRIFFRWVGSTTT